GKYGSSTDFIRFTPFLVLDAGADPEKLTYFNRFGISSTGEISSTSNLVKPMSVRCKTSAKLDGSTIDLKSWGKGCVYNSEIAGNYFFSDFNGDSRIDYKDSLNPDENGNVTFYVFADQVFMVGGLLGANKASVIKGDVAGDAPRSQSMAFNPLLRYKGDGTFALDWDTPTVTNVPIKQPVIRLYDQNVGDELSTGFLSPSNYDLAYGTDNVFVARVTPACQKETDPIKPGGIIEVASVGAKSEVKTSVETIQSKVDPKAAEAIVHYTPTSNTGTSVATLSYKAKATFGEDVAIARKSLEFDVAKGASLNVVYTGTFYPGLQKKIAVTVEDVASRAPLSNVTVTVQGAGVMMEAKTGPKGEVEFDVLPTKPGKIVVRLDSGTYITVNPQVIEVVSPVAPPPLELEEVPPLTKEDQITIRGKTNSEAVVSVGGNPVSVGADGVFFVTVTLKEGVNEIEVIAANPVGTKISKKITITKDTTPPVIELVQPKTKLVNAKQIEIEGNASEKAKLAIDGKIIDVGPGKFVVTLDLVLGKNTFKFEATDALGNQSRPTLELYNWQIKLVQMKIGNDIMLVDGQISKLDVAPYVDSQTSRTLVPVRAIAQAFGAKVDWNAQVKQVTITLGKDLIMMTIGSKVAIVNGKISQLEQPPLIKDGRTVLPFRFIAEALGAEVQWNGDEKTITMTRYY
ncbi:MAG: copper amine oxidase N-terminal domain-containing protein, partial [Caldisericales bacterium]|nr:copper amine oxidase N-terminal domain-containing protein [Caldisericales bacterium]